MKHLWLYDKLSYEKNYVEDIEKYLFDDHEKEKEYLLVDKNDNLAGSWEV